MVFVTAQACHEQIEAVHLRRFAVTFCPNSATGGRTTERWCRLRLVRPGFTHRFFLAMPRQSASRCGPGADACSTVPWSREGSTEQTAVHADRIGVAQGTLLSKIGAILVIFGPFDSTFWGTNRTLLEQQMQWAMQQHCVAQGSDGARCRPELP